MGIQDDGNGTPPDSRERESILVVDDEAPIRGLLARALGDSCGEVFVASSGEEALRVFEERHPGVVISDIRMPGMGGLDLLRELRRRDPDAEVILITGFGEMGDAVEAIRHGASDFIAKPFDLALVEHAVAKSLERRRLKAASRDYTRRLEEEVRRRTEELVRANRQLERLAKTREEFLTLIAHELKTPLAGMGLAELALEDIGNLDLEGIAECLHGILEAFRRIHRFSDRALLYSRLLSGEPRAAERVDFAALVVAEVDRARPAAEAGRITVCFEPPETPLEIEGDPDLLRFVVRALLENAIKFNVRGGTVWVRLEATPTGFLFSVRDTGVGIAPEAREVIFQPLASADIAHHHAGTGLSLAISRLVAASHGMSLECASEGIGRGSTFTLTCGRVAGSPGS